MTPDFIDELAETFEVGFLVIGAAMLLIEGAKGLFSKRLGQRGVWDIVASISTQLPTTLFEVLVMSLAYAGYILVAEVFVSWTFPITGWLVVLTLLVCDFVYYWEHRIAHEVRIMWVQHAVHHSSRFMNPSVAVRFGPFEGFLSALMHLPLVFLGFPPELVFFGVIVVLAYQTWIHTELIGKLGVLDTILNTPANHRVHHGCEGKYIDKNYGGILIIWDRLFGTYQREEETPKYGLKRDFSSINPLVVWFSEWPQFLRDVATARSLRDAWKYIFDKPGWVPTPPKPMVATRPTQPPNAG